MNIVNLTPHDINVVMDDQTIKVYPKSGKFARINTITEYVGELDNVPVVFNKFGDATDLPEPTENTVYIVSMLVCQAFPNRQDLVCPDTSPDGVVRDGEGKIIGTKRFARY